MKIIKELLTALAIVLLAIFGFMLSGCSQSYKVAKCQKWGVCKTVKDSTYVLIKDSTYLVPVPYSLPSDTAVIRAWLACSDSNDVLIERSEIINGQYIRLQNEIRDGKFTVYAYLPKIHDTVLVTATTHSEVNHHSTSDVQYVKRDLKWWQIALMLTGVAAILYYAYKGISVLIKFLKKWFV